MEITMMTAITMAIATTTIPEPGKIFSSPSKIFRRANPCRAKGDNMFQ
jgi:hypothetical protein